MTQPTDNIVRAYQAEALECRDGERAVIARVNTGDVDRYRTIIEPGGIDLANYKLNPVLQWEHSKDPRRGAMPIGKCQWIKYDRSANCLVAKAIFGTDPFADQLFKLYQDGTLRAFSVNILPREASPPTKEERRTRPELDRCEMIYRSSELAEFSAVSVPGNANALAIAVSRGLWVPDEVRETLPEPEAEAPESESRDMGDAPDADDADDGDDAGGFDARSLACTERHEMGHCPKCGEQVLIAERAASGMGRCMKGHEFSNALTLACPYSEPARSAPEPELPPLTGKPFGDVYASIVMQVRSQKAALLKQIREEIDLLHGRV